MSERDSDGFMEWLGDFARDYGDEAMVADDLSARKPVVERLGIERQIRIARRFVRRAPIRPARLGKRV